VSHLSYADAFVGKLYVGAGVEVRRYTRYEREDEVVLTDGAIVHVTDIYFNAAKKPCYVEGHLDMADVRMFPSIFDTGEPPVVVRANVKILGEDEVRSKTVQLEAPVADILRLCRISPGRSSLSCETGIMAECPAAERSAFLGLFRRWWRRRTLC
jgi:hypothetical protein